MKLETPHSVGAVAVAVVVVAAAAVVVVDVVAAAVAVADRDVPEREDLARPAPQSASSSQNCPLRRFHFRRNPPTGWGLFVVGSVVRLICFEWFRIWNKVETTTRTMKTKCQQRRQRTLAGVS